MKNDIIKLTKENFRNDKKGLFNKNIMVKTNNNLLLGIFPDDVEFGNKYMIFDIDQIDENEFICVGEHIMCDLETIINWEISKIFYDDTITKTKAFKIHQ